MIETRDTLEYAGRVWMYGSLRDKVKAEALARIEALLPGGYSYRVRKEPDGWRATYGGKDEESAWGLPHAFRTETGAIIGLLSVMCDECVYPGCQTAFSAARQAERLDK